MKLKYLIAAAFVVLGLSMTSCEYDNYDAPSYSFNGQLKCDGEDFLFDSSKELLKVYQTGYGKSDPGENIRIDQYGHYKQLFFNAEYKMTLVSKTYPFELPDFEEIRPGIYDSITYNFTSNVTKDFEVRPYYKLKNLKTELKNGNVVATFNIEKMTNTKIAAPKISKTRIWLSTSNFVNSNIKCTRVSDAEYIDDTTLEVYIPVSEYYKNENFVNNFRTYAFCRVAIELEGRNEYFLFSTIEKIEGLPGK